MVVIRVLLYMHAFSSSDCVDILQKMANSLDVGLRHNLSSFADAVEKIMKEQMHLELQFDSAL